MLLYWWKVQVCDGLYAPDTMYEDSKLCHWSLVEFPAPEMVLAGNRVNGISNEAELIRREKSGELVDQSFLREPGVCSHRKTGTRSCENIEADIENRKSWTRLVI